MKKKLLAALIAATMVVPTIAAPVFAEETEPENTVTGDASAEGSFVVWGWNDDIKKILDGPFKDAYPEDYERIVFVNTGGSDYYQNKLDPMLDDTSNELYPDLMGLEVDYVQKYVNSDWVVTADSLGITADDYKNMYQYNVDLGSDTDGNCTRTILAGNSGMHSGSCRSCRKISGNHRSGRTGKEICRL